MKEQTIGKLLGLMLINHINGMIGGNVEDL